MTGIEDLLERIDVPVVNADDDVARGERALRRRRGWQVSAAVASVAAVVCGGAALHGSAGAPGAGPAVAPGSPTATTSHHSHACGLQARGCVRRSHHRVAKRLLTAKQAERRAERLLSSQLSQQTVQRYYVALGEHLDPGGDKLRLAQNEQLGGDSFGTKLDWNGGGMLEIVVGRAWADAAGFADLDSAGMTDTTYHGLAARVSTLGDDLVASVRHQDGVVVTLIASTSFGNNGTSTTNLGLTRQQLLSAAADPRLTLPSFLH